MRIAREYTTYLAHALTARLQAENLVTAHDPRAMAEVVHKALAKEFGVEDRINDEARAILQSHAAEMQQLGASYGDAFKKIKAELVRQKKVVL